jgi:hypothetical protein
MAVTPTQMVEFLVQANRVFQIPHIQKAGTPESLKRAHFSSRRILGPVGAGGT